MFIFKAGPRKVFQLKSVRCAKKVAEPCPKAYRPTNDVICFVTQNHILLKFKSLNKSVKLKFPLCLRKQAKIHKFAKKRLFYLSTVFWEHLKIVPSYLAIQLGKVKKFKNFN